MGFFSNLFNSAKKVDLKTKKEDQFVLQAREYLKDKQAKGFKLSIKDYLVLDILNGEAEKKFAKLLKESLNWDKMYYNSNSPDVLWCSSDKYASVFISLQNFNHNRTPNGDDVSILLVIDDATDDDIEYEDFTHVSIYLENNDERSTDIDFDDENDEGTPADAEIPLDVCPTNVKNTDFIYENATQKVKEALIKLNII